MDTELTREQTRNGIVADWNSGITCKVTLGEKWGFAPKNIEKILTLARRLGLQVNSIDKFEAARMGADARRANKTLVKALPPDRPDADAKPYHARNEYIGDHPYETAFSINDLTTDAYRIVSVCHVVGGLNRWDSTIPTAEMGLLNEQANEGAIFAPQALLGGKFVRLARIVRLHGRR